MKKRHILYFCLALVLAGIVIWNLDDTAPGLEESVEQTTITIQEGGPPELVNEDLASLAMRSIDLRQGEGGMELWRLRAEWGAMHQEDGLMILEKPRFTYHMEDGRELLVTSDSGEIDQEEHIVRFIDSVEAILEDNVLRGPMMVYDGKAGTLTLPDPATYQGPDMSMSAAAVVWFLNDKRIEANGDVVVDWEREESFSGPNGDGNGLVP